MIQNLILGGIALFALWKAKQQKDFAKLPKPEVLYETDTIVLGGEPVRTLITARPSTWASPLDISNYNNVGAQLGGGIILSSVQTAAVAAAASGAIAPSAPSETYSPPDYSGDSGGIGKVEQPLEF
jgi:hypothetical protein